MPTGQNNIHLDLTTTSIEDQQTMVDRLIGAGARRVDVGQSGEEGHVVLADPEGNEFCIIEPHSSFISISHPLTMSAFATKSTG